MWVLKGICSNVQAMEYFKEGENICLTIDEMPDLIVLVSGSAAVHMQVSYLLFSSTSVFTIVLLCPRYPRLTPRDDDVLPLVIFHQVEDNLGNTTKRRVALRDKPVSLLTSIMDILSMVGRVFSSLGLYNKLVFLKLYSRTPCSQWFNHHSFFLGGSL